MAIIQTYNHIREEQERLERMTNYFRNREEYKNEPETYEYIIKETRKDLKADVRKFYKTITDPLATPITNNIRKWRTISTDGETATDFIIIPDKWTDLWGTENENEAYEDIKSFVFETVGYESPYDFSTGKEITMYWSFKRTGAGIAIVHERGIDW